jgi:arginine-tRNA-protein transferase
MSILLPDTTVSKPFYLSGPLPCPYLTNQVERKLFTRFGNDRSANDAMNAALTRTGFRRSHDIVYRSACPMCNACVPVRIDVMDFAPTRSLKNVLRRNADLIMDIAEPATSDELYDLFANYVRARHHDSDMANMTKEEFAMMMRDGNVTAKIYGLRKKDGVGATGPLMGAILADTLRDGFSAVYSFFRTNEPKRSLGTQLVLALIDEARRRDLSYIYLGYWIAASRKMAYKARFPALQALGPLGWSAFSGGDDNF